METIDWQNYKKYDCIPEKRKIILLWDGDGIVGLQENDLMVIKKKICNKKQTRTLNNPLNNYGYNQSV